MHTTQMLGIFCSEKTLTQSSFWRRRFIWFISYSPSSGRPRQELKTGMWKEELKQSHEWGLHQQSIKTPHRHGHRQSDRGIFQLRVCFQIILTCIMKTKQTNKMTSAAQFAQINCIYIMGSLKLFYRFIYEYSYESCIHPNLW